MSKKETGGPAFPLKEASTGDALGMTLRDYFAGHALAGMLADLPKTMYGLDWQRNVAKGAFELADAMLAERAK